MDLQYSNINLDDTTESSLQDALKNDYKVYQQMRTKISSLKKADQEFKIEKTYESKDACDENMDIITSDIDEEFEDEVNYYYFMVKNINTSDLESNLITVLPTKENYLYDKILLRISAEIMSNIKFMRDLLNDEGVTDEDVLAFSNDINIELEKIRIINSLLKDEQKECYVEQEVKNRLVFVPTLNGNIRIIEDIKGIASDYYPKFNVLIKSIEDGTFKGAKRFYVEGLNGLCEVRFLNTRVLFCQLDKNTYGIIGAFVKKITSDTYYKTMINNYNSLYRSSLDILISNLSDPEFMNLQDEYYKELFNILEPQTNVKVKSL